MAQPVMLVPVEELEVLEAPDLREIEDPRVDLEPLAKLDLQENQDKT